jgi:membrane protein DedA with SNARE-associated domain
MVANIITDLTDWIDEIAAYWWFPLIVFTVALLDSIIPIVPSETTVIAGGVAAGAGNQQLAIIIAAGAAGAFIGDNLAYTIGHRFGPRVRRWSAKKPERAAKLDGAATQIKRRGGPLLITARFIPGGRTVLTLSCGLTAQPRRWFAFWIAIAAVVWSSYAALLGYAFGAAFEDNHTIAFLLAFGVALSITALVELIRWARGSGNDESTPSTDTGTITEIVTADADTGGDDGTERESGTATNADAV